ncbi:MAG TPA: hypothetical protein VFH99_03160 [Candidatus Saccharimonadales bacterium]|nr:hypothetical protein [Candidatus Saccharimonadales bacterium]
MRLTAQPGNKETGEPVDSVRFEESGVARDFRVVREMAPIDGVDRDSYIAKNEDGETVARIGVGHEFAGRTRVGLNALKPEAKNPHFLHDAASVALRCSGVEVAWFNPATADIPETVLEHAALAEEATGNYLFVAA